MTMPLPEGSRGEHDAPAPPTCERDEPTGKHLYLIFDDWPWGYSIRKLELPPPGSPHPPPEYKPLPPPCIRLEASRRHPLLFAAAGASIIAAHPRNSYSSSSRVFDCFLPIVDVRPPLGVRFGPGLLYASPNTIMITAGDGGEEVFALGMEDKFRMLSMKPVRSLREWAWRDLPPPPLQHIDVTSYAVGEDGRTIFASTDCATFAFDIVNSEWRQSSNCSLPFHGPVNYVHALDIFVGFSRNPDTYGHLCFCSKLGGGDENGVRLGKENLLMLSKDPPGSHRCATLGATLVYLGGSEPGFCLVECLVVSFTEGRPEECDQLVKCVGGANCGESDQLKKCVDEQGNGSMDES